MDLPVTLLMLWRAKSKPGKAAGMNPSFSTLSHSDPRTRKGKVHARTWKVRARPRTQHGAVFSPPERGEGCREVH